MRLWLFPAALLLGGLCAKSTQVIFPSESFSTTLVDALGDDPDYNVLLRLLQRARLIPTLNRLTSGCTFFAPVNSAWDTHPFKSLHDDVSSNLGDNINEELRQLLFYHLVNYTIPTLPTDEQIALVLKTLYYPHKPIDLPAGQPPSYPPWMPIANGTLGTEPQRLRLTSKNESMYVGVDAFGHGGTEIIKGRDVGSSTLFGISAVLQPPSNLANVLSQHSDLSYFNQISPGLALDFINSTSELTLFLPTNDAWTSLHPVERLFLESQFSGEEVQRILTLHAVEQDVAWSDRFYPAVNLTNMHGSTLEIVVSPEKTMISSATLLQPDIYASNGVIHLVSSLLISEHHLKLTPEKYLLALNCSTFVSLLHSANLTSLVNQTDSPYTILAPSDDILSLYGIGQFADDGDLPEPGSRLMQTLLNYHFIPGKWVPDSLKNGMLLETALIEGGLQGNRQVIPVQVKKDKSSAQSIKFGGSGTLGDHIEIGNTVIYFITKPVSPPSDALESVLPRLHLSSFLAAMFSTSLASTLKTSPLTTILVPNNDAFGDRLGDLVTTHLLSSSGKKDLEKVILHHVIDGVHYANSFKNGGKHSFPTLEGSDVQMVTVNEDSNRTWSIAPSGGWRGMHSTLTPTNIITKTGVVHEVSDLLLPRSVNLNLMKLLKAANGDTMIRMMTTSGYGWILNGTEPPSGSPWEAMKDTAWIILCPDDDAFSESRLEDLLENPDQLQEMVEQHLLPYPSQDTSFDSIREANRPMQFDDTPTYSTLRSPDSSYGDIVITQPEGQVSYVIGIKGARGTDAAADWARIVSWGRASDSGDSLFPGQGGGVIRIDRILYPYYPPWWLAVGVPILVGIIGGITIVAFFAGVLKFWRREAEATYEPLGGFGQDDE